MLPTHIKQCRDGPTYFKIIGEIHSFWYLQWSVWRFKVSCKLLGSQLVVWSSGISSVGTFDMIREDILSCKISKSWAQYWFIPVVILLVTCGQKLATNSQSLSTPEFIIWMVDVDLGSTNRIFVPAVDYTCLIFVYGHFFITTSICIVHQYNTVSHLEHIPKHYDI